MNVSAGASCISEVADDETPLQSASKFNTIVDRLTSSVEADVSFVVCREVFKVFIEAHRGSEDTLKTLHDNTVAKVCRLWKDFCRS